MCGWKKYSAECHRDPTLESEDHSSRSVDVIFGRCPLLWNTSSCCRNAANFACSNARVRNVLVSSESRNWSSQTVDQRIAHQPKNFNEIGLHGSSGPTIRLEIDVIEPVELGVEIARLAELVLQRMKANLHD